LSQVFSLIVTILDQAAERGRNVERQRRPGDDATTRGRLRQQLQRRQDRE